MGSELNINFAIAIAKFDLSEFVVTAKNLGHAALRSATASREREQAISSIQKMIEETRTSFVTIVKILSPLDRINTPRKFSKSFDDIHGKFKILYQTQRSLPRTHCESIKKQMDKLNKKRKWMDAIPIAKRSFQQLEDICKRWATNDDQIVADMTDLMERLNEFLTRVARLKGEDMDTAYAEFRFGVDIFEDNFRAVERSLSELSIVSKELGA